MNQEKKFLDNTGLAYYHTKIQEEIEQKMSQASNTAYTWVENKWFTKHRLITGFPTLDWCLFEPSYSDKLVLQYSSDDPTAPDIDVNAGGR